MNIFPWSKILRGSARRTRIRSRAKLHVESLEIRSMLTTLFVESGAVDGDGSPQEPFGSIQEAVTAAVASPGPDTIMIRSGKYIENIETEELDDNLIIQGIGEVEITALDPDEDVISIEGNGNVTIRNVSIVGGDRGLDIEVVDGSVKLLDVATTTSDSDGVRVQNADKLKIVKGSFEYGSDGMDLEENSTVHIIHTSAKYNSDEGLEVDDSGSILVVGGKYLGNEGEGLDIDNTDKIKVVNVVGNGNDGSGLQVEAGDDEDPDFDIVSRVAILNSRFEDNGEYGVQIQEGVYEDEDGNAVRDGEVKHVRLNNVVSLGNVDGSFDLDISGKIKMGRVVSD